MCKPMKGLLFSPFNSLILHLALSLTLDQGSSTYLKGMKGTGLRPQIHLLDEKSEH